MIMIMIVIMMLFNLGHLKLDTLAHDFKILIEVNLIMMMTELYLMALMGKNLPVLFSSVLISKKGLLQRCRSFLVNIPFLTYSSS